MRVHSGEEGDLLYHERQVDDVSFLTGDASQARAVQAVALHQRAALACTDVGYGPAETQSADAMLDWTISKRPNV